MNNVKGLILLLVILLTSGCGAVNSLIPDQVIVNPLSLDNWPVLLKSSNELTAHAQSSSISLQGAHSVSFPDFDTGLPSGVTPSSYDIELGFQEGVTIASSSELPTTVTLRNLILNVVLYNGAEGVTDRITYSATYPADLVLNKNTGCVTFCSYTWDEASRDAAANVLNTSIRDHVLQQAVRILRNNPGENTVSIQLIMETDLGTEHAGAALTVRVRSERGLMKF